MRYELTDFERTAIRPFLPNKPRGVPRVNDRRVLNGIFWILWSGAPWRDLPENRFVRWWMAGNWDLIMEALAEIHDGSVQMIDTSIVRVGSEHSPANKFVLAHICTGRAIWWSASWIKQCRRVVTRYDKLAANCLAFIKLAAIRI